MQVTQRVVEEQAAKKHNNRNVSHRAQGFDLFARAKRPRIEKEVRFSRTGNGSQLSCLVNALPGTLPNASYRYLSLYKAEEPNCRVTRTDMVGHSHVIPSELRLYVSDQ
jgi:hypothetical protein